MFIYRYDPHETVLSKSRQAMKRTLQYPKKIVDIYFLEMNNRHTFENAFFYSITNH